jgi:hypothetical protein
MDKTDCDRRFGAANIDRVDTFKINGGGVDFGDHAHVAGSPQGDAVICWLKNGKVAVLGKLFSDNFRNAQTAKVEIRFRRTDGRVANLTTRSVGSQGGFVTWRDIEKVSPPGEFREVRIRLKQFLFDSGLGPSESVVATRTFRRRDGESVQLHLKILRTPNVNIDTMIDAMKKVYASVDISVNVASREELNLPDLRDIDVGLCVMGLTTREQNELFLRNRNSVGANEIVIYFVATTIPPFNGCAAHPIGVPSAVVAQGATKWTLAHEVGHVLGLLHVDDDERLMTKNGTGAIARELPILTLDEAQTMYASQLT